MYVHTYVVYVCLLSASWVLGSPPVNLTVFEQALSIVIILLYVCIWHAYIQMDILVLVHFLTVFMIRIYAVWHVRTYIRTCEHVTL